MTEFSLKQERVHSLLEKYDLDALVLQRVSSFAWATCGAASYVNTASSFGAASLVITRSGHHLVTDNIEAPRLLHEEKLNYQGWEFHVGKWYEASPLNALISGMKVGADHAYPGALDLSGELARLRATLTPEEGVRFRVLGRLCAEAMNATIKQIQPGMTEHDIASRLAYQNRSRGVQAMVNLIASDERVFTFRHPLPTFKPANAYIMLVVCGRRWGLVCSMTRLVHFGPLPDELRRKADAVAQVDAALINATRPGKTINQVFQRGVQAYAAAGYPDEWQLHHQGGPTGYEPREWVATPNTNDPVMVNQVYAWNPSITGTKSEDTIQVGEKENEVITLTPGWPMRDVQVDGQTLQRPDILVID
ncbi:MAG: M24 family metallopeptidase [Chloroflexota bacterium]